MAFWAGVLGVLLWIWSLFVIWLSIFIAPLKNLDMLWIIIPIWLNWFFAEFFQEKKGTSLGNAITNGGVMIWVGIDWSRYIVRLISDGTIHLGWLTFIKFVFAFVVLVIGLIIVLQGIKQKSFVHFAGRIRVVTYILVMFSPVIYGVLPLSWQVFLAIVVFAPLFYYLIELIDYYTPTPKAYEEKS